MKGKLKTNLIIMEVAFLLIVVGGSAVIYSCFGASFYDRGKARLILDAFGEVCETDMSDLRDSDYEMLGSYENEHLAFIIADEAFTPVYTTASWDPDGSVRRNIQIIQEKYVENPAVLKGNRMHGGARLRGCFYQGGEKYYVYIRETSGSTYSAFSYTERFLAVVVILAVLVGSVVMFLLSRRIARPIEKMAVVSRQLAEHDFSARVTEETPYEEVNVLARNFNDMASQIQHYIQELEQSNEKLVEQNVQKERLERMRQEFSANISHELKTPLAVIASQVEMLQFLENGEEREYYFASIREEIDKMSEMIRNLLKLSAAEHQLGELEQQEVDLKETTEYLLLKYDALFRSKEIRCACSMEQDCVVWADRGSLEQAMSNYLLNAFAHTGVGGNIRITIERVEDEAFFRVYNDGEQISEEEAGKIWNSYYQGRREDDHAGLGLYIVRTVVLLHGGRYGMENRPRGVEFWFSLPVMEDGR